MIGEFVVIDRVNVGPGSDQGADDPGEVRAPRRKPGR